LYNFSPSRDTNSSTPSSAPSSDPSKLTASAFASLTREQLRSYLRFLDLPSRVNATAESLRDMLLPYLDEKERAKHRLAEAVAKEDFEEAARIQGAKSRRQIVEEEMDEAVARQDFGEAARLKKVLEEMTERRADPTQDEGSYDPYLDADDWYKPAR